MYSELWEESIMEESMKAKCKVSWVLRDARFISIIKLLIIKDYSLAIYLTRLIGGFGVVPARTYLYKIDTMLANSMNRESQYKELK